LKLVHVLEPPVPIEKIVTEVGLAKVIEDNPAQPSPGQSVLDQASGEWIITLNLNNGAADRRFVIAHEVKHILDHGFGTRLYRPVDMLSAQEREEHAADYFATCLLMPRLWVERYRRRGVRSSEKMASLFGMTAARAQLWMEALGLLEANGDETMP
jgi:Zn-dependent peptidase ImmA (M78 family)